MNILYSLILFALLFVGCDLFNSENDTTAGTDDITPPIDVADSLGVNDSLAIQDSLVGDAGGTPVSSDSKMLSSVGAVSSSSVVTGESSTVSSSTDVLVVDTTTVPVDSATEKVDSTGVPVLDTIGHGSYCDSMAIAADVANRAQPYIELVKQCTPETVDQLEIDVHINNFCILFFDEITASIEFESTNWSNTCFQNESEECIAREQPILAEIDYFKNECPANQVQLDSIEGALPMYVEVIDTEYICDSITSDAEFYLEKMFREYEDECLYVTSQCSTYMAPLAQYENEIAQLCPSRSPSFKRFTPNDSTIIYVESEDGLYPEYCDDDNDGVTTLEEKYNCVYDENNFHECDYNLDDLLAPHERKSCGLLGIFGSCDTSGDGQLDFQEKRICQVVDPSTGCKFMNYYDDRSGGCRYDTRPEVSKLRDSLSVECNTLLDIQLDNSSSWAEKDSAIYHYGAHCVMDEMRFTMPEFDDNCQRHYTDIYESEYIFLANRCAWDDVRPVCTEEVRKRNNLVDDMNTDKCIEQAQVTSPHWSLPII
ncbi:MAG: hypothetical protein OCC49_05970 [Fibrobacterales bacterium]